MPDNPYRLPRTVVPSRYRIRLEPDLESAAFTGSETIDVTVETPVQEIVLNCAEIEIDTAELIGETTTLGASARYDAEMERVTLALESTAQPGDWQLRIGFRGVLNDQLRGFYRSRFTDVDGKEQLIATTQFESTDARRAFPCWDEPDFKATFRTTLVVPSELMAITNTGEESRETTPDGRLAITFKETMKMSTYLVAFVVGPFEATEPLDVDGVPTRIITARGKQHLADYALESAEFCFRYLRDYYGIDYPGDKLDHIAIPDFAFGAMENVGAITYRETALLLDPGRASQAEKQRILDVIGHEIAHQWFGNLVTMGWWEGIWLNEAFASFMEMKATDARRPEWERWLSFQATTKPWAMEVDHLSTTRPVQFEVTSPEEADQMFDALTYGKGSSVLRMIEQFIGEDAFRQGVGSYLRNHSFANTVTSDLWVGLDGSTSWPVGEIMNTWILQGGYPQIDVSGSSGKLRLSQRRFLAIADDADQTVWKVPLQLRGKAGGRAFEMTLLFEDDEGEVELESSEVDWVTANAGGWGFYRVRYSPDLLESIVAHVDELDANERYGLLYDAFAFAQTGQSPMASVLEMLNSYRSETEQAVWQLVFRVLGWVHHHVVADADHDAFARYVRAVVGPLVDALGLEARSDDSDLVRRLRGQAIGVLGALGEDPKTVDWALETTAAYLDGGDVEDAELLTAGLGVTAADGDPDMHASFLKRSQDSSNPQEQLRFLRALCSFDDFELGKEVIAATYDGRIRNQDGSWVQAALMSNRTAGPALWSEVRRRWDEAVATFPPMTFRRLVEGLSALSRPEAAADVKAFFAETEVPVASKALEQNLELLEANLATRQRESQAISHWLQTHA